MKNSFIFVDSRVTNRSELLKNVPANSTVIELDATQDGVQQIAKTLSAYSNVDSVHVVSHGSAGALYLGSTVLTSQNMANYSSALSTIGNSLSATGDLMLYGCNVAEGAAGAAFVSQLAQATGADVAASTDATGTATAQANTQLEYKTGTVETAGLSLDGLQGTLGGLDAGMVTTNFSGTSDDVAWDMALQADGKIVLVGESAGKMALARYNTNGTLDTSFDGDGLVTNDLGNTSDDAAYGITIQSNGKLVVVGKSGDQGAITRYNTDGSLDTSFSGDGVLITNYTDPVKYNDVVVTANGTIAVVGCGGYGSWDKAFVAQYSPFGLLNPNKSFSFFYENNAKDTGASSVLLQSDGKLVVTGGDNDLINYSTRAGVQRFNADGSFDTTFDGGFLADSGDYAGAFDVQQQADGKLLIASEAGGDFTLYRFNTDGTADTSFDGDGKVVTDFAASDSARKIFVQEDGSIVVGGYSGDDFAIARYTSTGELDYSFNSSPTDLGGADKAYTMAVQADGKIILGGKTNVNGNNDFVMVRYNTDGTIDSTFGDTNAVANSTPTGNISIQGTATQGQTLRATSTLADADGLGSLSYQWFANGTAIAGAASSSFTITSGQVGKTISVKASYTDGRGTAESVTSATTSTVTASTSGGGTTGGGTTGGGTTGGGTTGTVGIVFTDSTGLVTTESGGTASFKVALGVVPRHDVTLTFSINDSSEGKFQSTGNNKASVTFTPSDWNTPKTVTLVGVDDADNDFEMAYIVSTRVESNDLRYDGMRSGTGLGINNITVINQDNDEIDELYGDAGGVVSADYLVGGNGASDVYGRDGRDEIYGGNGNDRLYGGNGDDVLFGQADDDELEGDQGNDKLYGDSGNDVLTGGTGNDSLYGGSGNDELDGSSGKDFMDGGNGADKYYVDNAADKVSDSGTDGAKDTLYISTYLQGGYTLGAGIDNAVLSTQANDAALTGNGEKNTLTGNASNNALNGGAGNDTLNGGDGKDSLIGGTGTDSLVGGVGNDTITAGTGNDVVIGGAGKDALTGGDGSDVFKLEKLADSGLSTTARDIVADFVKGEDKLGLAALDANTSTSGDQAFTKFISSSATFSAAGQLQFKGGILYGNTDADSDAEFSIALTGVTTLTMVDIIA